MTLQIRLARRVLAEGGDGAGARPGRRLVPTSRHGSVRAWLSAAWLGRPRRRRDGKLDRLAMAPPLRSLSRRDLHRVGALCDEITFPGGSVLLARGDRPRHWYLVLSGTVTIGPDGPEPLSEANAVGLAAAAAGAPQNATVMAATPVRALAVDHRYLAEMAALVPALRCLLERTA